MVDSGAAADELRDWGDRFASPRMDADGRKGAGILLESETDGSGGLEWLVLGIGINVQHFPSDAEFPATSLRNAFISALNPAIDHQISIASVDSKEQDKTFFQKLFGKDDDKKEKKK